MFQPPGAVVNNNSNSNKHTTLFLFQPAGAAHARPPARKLRRAAGARAAGALHAVKQ